MRIWTYINNDVCPNLYHVEQSWYWLKSKRTDLRRYSFLGLYRKYSEADYYELARLKMNIKSNRAVRKVEPQVLYAQFKRESVFSIFFRDVKVLQCMQQWLENTDFEKELDDDENELESAILRRIYFQLARFHLESDGKIRKNADEAIGVNGKCDYLLASRMSHIDPQFQQSAVTVVSKSTTEKDEAKKEEEKDDHSYQCDSVLYRILYSSNMKSRDMILEIASKCE